MIRLKDSYWQPIHREIQNFLWIHIFDPIFNILSVQKPFENSSISAVVSAIQSGKIVYQNGVFTGPFSIAISRELSRFATFSPKTKTWIGLPPPEIVSAAAIVKFKNHSINEQIARLLPNLDAQINDALKNVTFPISPVIDSLNQDIKESLPDLSILPNLTGEAARNLEEFYNDRQKFNIQNFVPEQISRLRQVIEQNVRNGYNRQELETLISSEWEVSANKARFLARQETSIFVSTFRDQRYQSAGVEEYVWMSSHDSRCREANKYGGPAHGPGGPLHGHIFRFDNPPVSGTRGEKENPGIPFGCRCIAKPILPNK